MSERMPLFTRSHFVSLAIDSATGHPSRFDKGSFEAKLTDSQAKQKFLQHLEEVDTSEGLANTLVLKFRLAPEIEAELNAFVTEHQCSMESRVLTREEQDKIDKRCKTCAQYTWFQVTPEAQEEYLKNRKVSLSSGKKATPQKAPVVSMKAPAATPKKAAAATPKKTAPSSTPAKTPRKANKQQKTAEKETPESEDDALPETDESDEVRIPIKKYDDFCGRLASALLLLPTVDPVRSAECRDTLLEVAHEMRQLRPLKRPLNDDDDGKGGSSRTPAKKRRV